MFKHLHVILPLSIHKDIKTHCVKYGITMSQFIRGAIMEALGIEPKK